MKPYGLMADLHLHNWSAFASIEESGVNARLQLLLNEIRRCCRHVKNEGGDTVVIAGDVFHVRGSIAPSVLNPTLDTLRQLIKDGIRFVILAGNHDLEGKESNRIGSAITALEGIGCTVVNTHSYGLMALERAVLIPWTQKIDELKALIANAYAAEANPSMVDLILHAPIDGVIDGLPDHGLDPSWLGSQGFRRVFSGHYHNHKRFGTVWSIGALAHHTWSDVGSKAGFLIVGDEVRWHKSHAPEFVEINGSTDPDDIPLLVDGNYVRAKINSTKQKEVEELRAYLTSCGAKGVVILAQKDASVAARSGATINAGASLEVSVTDFIKAQSYASADKLAILCNDILAEARAA